MLVSVFDAAFDVLADGGSMSTVFASTSKLKQLGLEDFYQYPTGVLTSRGQ